MITQLGAEHDATFSVESSRAESDKLSLATSGIASITLTVKGRASHAGARPEAGVNALYELAHQVLQTRDFSDPAVGLIWTSFDSQGFPKCVVSQDRGLRNRALHTASRVRQAALPKPSENRKVPWQPGEEQIRTSSLTFSQHEGRQMTPLTQYGRMAEKHWREHCPKMVRALEVKGQLHAMLLEAEEKTKDEVRVQIPKYLNNSFPSARSA